MPLIFQYLSRILGCHPIHNHFGKKRSHLPAQRWGGWHSSKGQGNDVIKHDVIKDHSMTSSRDTAWRQKGPQHDTIKGVEPFKIELYKFGRFLNKFPLIYYHHLHAMVEQSLVLVIMPSLFHHEENTAFHHQETRSRSVDGGLKLGKGVRQDKSMRLGASYPFREYLATPCLLYSQDQSHLYYDSCQVCIPNWFFASAIILDSLQEKGQRRTVCLIHKEASTVWVASWILVTMCHPL